jgi:hypothetical protein
MNKESYVPGARDEMAHGFVSGLRATPAPERLRVKLNGHAYQEALYLAQAVADECSAAGTSLALVEVMRRHLRRAVPGIHSIKLLSTYGLTKTLTRACAFIAGKSPDLRSRPGDR